MTKYAPYYTVLTNVSTKGDATLVKNDLIRIIHKNKTTQGKVARALEMDPCYFNKIVNGKNIPNLVLAMRIAQHFGICVEDVWFQVADKKKEVVK